MSLIYYIYVSETPRVILYVEIFKNDNQLQERTESAEGNLTESAEGQLTESAEDYLTESAEEYLTESAESGVESGGDTDYGS